MTHSKTPVFHGITNVVYFELAKTGLIEKILRHGGLWVEGRRRGLPNRERVLEQVDCL